MEISISEFEHRRKLLAQHLLTELSEKYNKKDLSFSIIVVGNFETNSNPNNAIFNQDVNLFYLTGLSSAGLILVIEVKGDSKNWKSREWIFEPLRNGSSEMSLLGWAKCLHVRQKKHFLFEASGSEIKDDWISVNTDKKCYENFHSYLLTCSLVCPNISSTKDGSLSGSFWKQTLQNIKVETYSCLHIIQRLRQKKSDAEIMLIKKATDISTQAHLKVLKNLHDYKYDTDIEADFVKFFSIQLAETAYTPIVLIGEKANKLHGRADHTLLKRNQMLLCDVGSSFHGYKSDITRSMPIGGVFTKIQKKYYDRVLKALLFIEKKVKTGIFIYKGQDSLQAIFEKYVKDQHKWTPQEKHAMLKHGIGHHIALEVHDPEQKSLEPGSVISLEVGFYTDHTFPENLRNINIRIENQYIVDRNGNLKTLNEKLPLTTTEIEFTMRSK